MRLVLDCNVLIAAARTEGVCRAVIGIAVRHHEIVLSAPILEEYRAVAVRPKHAHCRDTALAVIEALETVAQRGTGSTQPVLPDTVETDRVTID